MPVKTMCPACHAPYTLADATRGKKVRCKQCERPFEVREAAGGISAGPPRRRPDFESPDDEAPPRRGRGRDDEDRPKSSALLWIIVGCVGSVLLIAGAVVTILLLNKDDAPPVAVGDPPPANMQMPPPDGPMRPGRNRPPFGPGPGLVPPAPPAPPPPLKAASTQFLITPHDNLVKDIVFAPKAQQVGCYYWEQNNPAVKWFDLYDNKTGKQACHLDVTAASSGHYMDVSPDGSRVALQDLANGKPLTIWSLPDGNVLYQQWNPYPKEPNPTLENISRQLVWFAFLDRDRLLTVATNGQYDLFDIAQKKVVYHFPVFKGRQRTLGLDLFARWPRNIAITADRRFLALSNKDGFDLIDTATGKVLGSSESLALTGKVGNEWSVAFSPDDKQLAAKLNLFEADRRQHEYVVVWDVATGQKKALYPVERDFNTNGPLVWWGTKHLVLHNSNAIEGSLLGVADGRVWRICERGGHGRFAASSPDGRLWYATSVAGVSRAQMMAVDLPEEELLRQPPPAGQARQAPRWYFRPEGITTVRQRGF